MDIYVFINGARKSLRQLSQESGVAYETLYARWKAGVPADQLVPKKSTGSDGFSPIAYVTETETGARITITDKNGTTTAEVKNGSGGDGTTDHAQLINRDAPEQHPITAITDLDDTLLAKVSTSDALTNMEIEKLLGGLT